VIEAMQFTGDNYWEIMQWKNPDADFRKIDKSVYRTDVVMILTLEGAMTANIGDWIIKGVKGEFYPCKPDIFAATYEPAED
jgi:hypothetical protein